MVSEVKMRSAKKLKARQIVRDRIRKLKEDIYVAKVEIIYLQVLEEVLTGQAVDRKRIINRINSLRTNISQSQLEIVDWEQYRMALE